MSGLLALTHRLCCIMVYSLNDVLCGGEAAQLLQTRRYILRRLIPRDPFGVFHG